MSLWSTPMASLSGARSSTRPGSSIATVKQAQTITATSRDGGSWVTFAEARMTPRRKDGAREAGMASMAPGLRLG